MFNTIGLITTGLGVSVVAGIIGGLCFVLRAENPQKRKINQTPWHCPICGNQFRSIGGILEIEKVITCTKCERKTCKEKCSRLDPQKGWMCTTCTKSDHWLKELFQTFRPPGTKAWNKHKMNKSVTTIDEIDEDLLELQRKERAQVRDFIERLVASLLGGEIDNVSVRKIYDDKNYEAIFRRYHADISNALTDLCSALHISISSKFFSVLSLRQSIIV